MLGMAVAVLCLAAGGPRNAHAVNYTATLDTVGSNFGSVSTVFLTPSVKPALTGDFSVDKSFVVRYEAPMGQKISVDVPAGFVPGDYQHQFNTLPLAGPSTLGSFDSLVFENLAGVGGPGAPTGSEVGGINGVPNSLFANAGGPFTDGFSFTAVTATYTLPAAYTTSFAGFDPAQVTLAFIATDPTGQLPAPDPWVMLMDVESTGGPGVIPEPITAGLGLMGLGVLAGATRRRGG